MKTNSDYKWTYRYNPLEREKAFELEAKMKLNRTTYANIYFSSRIN